MNPDETHVAQIFFPHTEKRTQDVLAAGNRFAYYTTAEVATKLIRDQKIWMRSVTTMNDYMEVEHGSQCVSNAWKTAPGIAFKGAIDLCFPGLGKELEDDFNGWHPHIRRNTFITCVSEHLAAEDEIGRLSMWRAYGGSSGVALVINGAVMFGESDALGAYASPVAYMSSPQFAEYFSTVTANIKREVDYVQSLGREKVKDLVFTLLRFAVLCTKHPGFHEEREWRVIASPLMYSSPLLHNEIEIIHGTPQAVLKIDLQNHPEHDLVGLALPELLNRIIIGPCQFPEVLVTAFTRLLENAGVHDAAAKVFVSDIPLR